MKNTGDFYLIKLPDGLDVDQVEEYTQIYPYQNERFVQEEQRGDLLNYTYYNLEPMEIKVEEKSEKIYAIKSKVETTIDLKAKYLYYISKERNDLFETFISNLLPETQVIQFDNDFFLHMLLPHPKLAPLQTTVKVSSGSTFGKDLEEISFEKVFNPLAHYNENNIDANIDRILFLYDPKKQANVSIHRDGKISLGMFSSEEESLEIINFFVNLYNGHLKEGNENE